MKIFVYFCTMAAYMLLNTGHQADFQAGKSEKPTACKSELLS